MSRIVIPGTAAAVAALLVLAGCTPSSDGTTQPAAEDRAPLTLSIGTLLPETGALAAFGPATEAAAELAAGDINNAKAGITVTIAKADSGDASTDTSITSATTLVDDDKVSVIVGAISDNVSRKVLDQIVKAGVVQISPGNVSTDFTRAADDGLYFRTSPSCVLEGDAMGRQIAADGASTLGIVYETGYCEPGLPEALSAAFERAGGKTVAEEAYSAGATDLSAQVTAVAAAKADAVVVVGGSGVASVPALSAAKYAGPDIYFVGLPITDHSTDIAAGAITGSIASMPGLDISKLDSFTDRLLDITPTLTDFSYAAETYDAVVLAALAALSAQSTKGADIAAALQEVSGGSGKGEVAGDFAAAAKVILAGGVVDYDGVSGPITFDAKGDPQGAAIGLYRYGKDNVFTRID